MSKVVIKGFNQILTSNDALCQDSLNHFWKPPISPMQLAYSDYPSTTTMRCLPSVSCLDTELIDQTLLFKPFGVNLLHEDNNRQNLDTFERIQQASTDLPILLANMPHTSHEESQALIGLLLGPPTIEAARRCK